MRKFVIACGMLVASFVLTPVFAEAACRDAAGLNSVMNAVQDLSTPGTLKIKIVMNPVSGCDEFAAVTSITVSGGTCGDGATSGSVDGHAGCKDTSANQIVRSSVSVNMSSVSCNTSATVYAEVGNRQGSTWIWSDSVGLSKTRHCSSPLSETEEDCEVDPAWWWENGNCYTEGTPIVISTGRDKPGLKDYKLTSTANGVLFDIDADGQLEQTAWTKQGAALAFLALDRNGNGQIDNGSELFGNFTVPGASNGFAALKTLSGDALRVDNTTALYNNLLLWTDQNHDGVSQPGELKSFSEQFSAIFTATVPSGRQDQHGNRFAFGGLVEEAATLDLRVIYDVFFRVR